MYQHVIQFETRRRAFEGERRLVREHNQGKGSSEEFTARRAEDLPTAPRPTGLRAARQGAFRPLGWLLRIAVALAAGSGALRPAVLVRGNAVSDDRVQVASD
jgi:hypothetical protein